MPTDIDPPPLEFVDDYRAKPADGRFYVMTFATHTVCLDYYNVRQEPNLGRAVGRFVALHLPVRQMSVAVVQDENGVVVVGYLSPTGSSLDARWWGCEAAFAELERWYDPVSVAIWSEMAQRDMRDGYVWCRPKWGVT